MEKVLVTDMLVVNLVNPTPNCQSSWLWANGDPTVLFTTDVHVFFKHVNSLNVQQMIKDGRLLHQKHRIR